MSPTYTMSAHFCRQVYSSWRETRRGNNNNNNNNAPTHGDVMISLATVKSNSAPAAPTSPRASFSSISSESSAGWTRPSSSSSSNR
ncbi:hypothetical protein MY11210_004964 [Beauveria gryllotalpidicola]